VMREWFSENYSDPVDCLPYQTSEGGYQYIWGGPYDAQESLSGQFGGVVPDDVIERLARELSDITPDWSANPDLFAPDDYLFDSVAPFSSSFGQFQTSMDDAELLLGVDLRLDLQDLRNRLVFANVIASVEAYLADFFISKIKGDAALKQRFVETTPEFSKQKLCLSEIHKAMLSLDDTVKDYLSQVIWHQLAKVRLMYKDTLGIEFPDGWQLLFDDITRRHDIVHRNGKTPDGVQHPCTQVSVSELVAKVRRLVQWIEERNIWPVPFGSTPPDSVQIDWEQIQP